MHYFESHKKSSEILKLTREKYPHLLALGLSDESMEVRYYLLQYLNYTFGYRGIPEKDKNGKPIPVSIQSSILTGLQEGKGDTLLYWSVSHSGSYVAFVVSDKPTGIDVAEYRERHASLLDVHSDFEYEMLGGKNWHNFYLLWTAKESIIKAGGGILDDMRDISLQQKYSSSSHIFAYRDQLYKINSTFSDELFLSYIIS